MSQPIVWMAFNPCGGDINGVGKTSAVQVPLYQTFENHLLFGRQPIQFFQKGFFDTPGVAGLGLAETMFQNDLIVRPAKRFRHVQVPRGSWIIGPAARPSREELDLSIEG